MLPQSSHDLLLRALEGDVRALARVVSEIENATPLGRAHLAAAFPRAGRARVLGLTGPPGVGKSSLTDRLTTFYRGRGQRVGIIAVDPTSPFSGGAILGDRIRMVGHFTDPGVFIRSMATRGHLGGLAWTTADVVDVLDAAGYDVVLVETIGVGQDDIEITRVAEICLLVMTPGLGDEIQVMKSGIMEVGDVYVINKADLPGADRVEASLHAALDGAGLIAARPIVRTVATAGEGIEDLARAVEEVASGLTPAARAERRLARARERVAGIVSETLLRRVRREVVPAEVWEREAALVARRERDPYAAAEEILSRLGVA